jgi:hypothetical protein
VLAADGGPLVAQVAGARAARGVPWLRAIRRAALTLDAEPAGLIARARLETPPGSVARRTSPSLAGPRRPSRAGVARS